MNRSDAPTSGAGMAAVHIYDARTGEFILSIGNVPATSLSMNFAPKTSRLIRTAISDFPQFGGVFQWDALPWSDAAYANVPGQSLEERIAHVAREELWKSAIRPKPVPLAQAPWREPRSNWKPRDPATPSECIDLTDFYNGHLETGWEPITFFDAADNNLASLPQGLVTLGGVPWDIRGVITLGRPELFPHVIWPAGKVVPGIRIGRKCARLHFLHALSFVAVEADVVARYRLHYSDGTAADLPIRLGLDAGAWWSFNEQSRASEGEVAWEGENLYAERQANARARIFHRSWDNPFPEKGVVSFDFISENDTIVPFLIAVTVE